MTLLGVDHAANIIRQSVNPDANIIFGSLIDETLQGKQKLVFLQLVLKQQVKKSYIILSLRIIILVLVRSKAK